MSIGKWRESVHDPPYSRGFENVKLRAVFSGVFANLTTGNSGLHHT